MRVLLAHNFYRIPGGEDSVVRDELALLRSHGVEAELFAASNDDIAGVAGHLATALQTVYSLGSRRRMARRLQAFRPDVVHIHNFFPLLSPSILDACRAADVPAVLTLHNFRILSPAALLHPSEALRDRKPRSSCWATVPLRVYRNSMPATLAVAAMIEFHKWAGTWTRKVDCFIALTQWAKKIFVAAGLPSERIVVKPSSVAAPPVCGGAVRNGGLFVGRLDDQKGVSVLLRAWRDIDYPLKIIGDGPLADLVRRSAGGRIAYLGRQPRNVVQREMQMAQFLVLPSLGHEMLPVTVLEAFASGLPVLSSDLPSLADLVEEGVTGWRFPPGDAPALAALARRAANDVGLDALGRRARAIYAERYTPEVNVSRLTGIYRSLRADRQTAAPMRALPALPPQR